MKSERTTAYGTILNKPAVDLASVRLARRPAPEPEIGDIEVGIPVPKKPGKQHSLAAAAVLELKPGQSRLFRNVEVKRLYGYAKTAKNKGIGQEYAVRLTDDGVRVWRLA
jgi:hypothetical protein